MKFVADTAIPEIESAFSTIGEVKRLPGDRISPKHLADADGLLVRTTTRVTPELLAGNRVRFVGTATIGTNHIDRTFLEAQGIHMASAPGCNATAVGEYVLAALLILQHRTGISLQNRTLGIIGGGNTGSAVKRLADAIGLSCCINDPPLKEKTGSEMYISLDELISKADIISLHVPLTRSGAHPTVHLLNNDHLARVKPGTILINTSRGETLDGEALKRNRPRLGAVVLDVWENEPSIDRDLLSLVDIGTPHIAGYSIEGKIRATEMIYHAACRFFNAPVQWDRSIALSSLKTPAMIIDRETEILHHIVTNACDILADDARLRRLSEIDKPDDYFAVLRNQYAFRREFSSFQLRFETPPDDCTRKQLEAIGFRIPEN